MKFIGRRVPKALLAEWEEEPGSIHLGKGIWMINLKRKKEDKS